jgi:hypothetical protein
MGRVPLSQTACCPRITWKASHPISTVRDDYRRAGPGVVPRQHVRQFNLNRVYPMDGNLSLHGSIVPRAAAAARNSGGTGVTRASRDACDRCVMATIAHPAICARQAIAGLTGNNRNLEDICHRVRSGYKPPETSRRTIRVERFVAKTETGAPGGVVVPAHPVAFSVAAGLTSVLSKDQWRRHT